jgi:hypothetical protein
MNFHSRIPNDIEHKKTFLLASMRVASLNLRTWQAEIDAVGIALKSGTISLDDAVEWLDGIGVLEWLPADPSAYDSTRKGVPS